MEIIYNYVIPGTICFILIGLTYFHIKRLKTLTEENERNKKIK